MLTYFLMCFTDFVPESKTRSDLGDYYIYVNFGNIGCHFIIMIASSLVQIK